MTKSRTSKAVLVGCGVAVLVIVGLFWVRSSRPKFREAQGIFTFVDVTARRASIEVVNPKSGAAVEVTGEVPAECEISINGAAVTMADLRVGDEAIICGRTQHVTAKDGKKGGRRFTAESIRVTR
jgi:hypothetical protein